jgi:cell division protein FtsI (penicillin-binding protein 3)
LRKVEEPVPGEQVIDPRVAKELLEMMESVVSTEGSGNRAALIGYRVAGKTGTAWTADSGSYNTSRIKASFGGVVPASHPRLAAIVIIDEPSGNKYYGGEVAAPVYANVMAGALRLLGVPPDGLDRLPATTLVQANP